MRDLALPSVLVLLATAALAHEGATVESVVPDSPAAAAGVRAGDRIVSIDGNTVASHDDLARIVASHRPGDTVPLVLERAGERITLDLSFGARPDGGASLGIAVRLAGEADPQRTGGGRSGTAECLAWIDDRYGAGAALEHLGLERSEDWAAIRRCVERDTRRMSAEDAVRYCDNVFKIHCSAGDLLAEIGETWLARCAAALGESLGRDVTRDPAWRTCAEPRLFDRYVLEGALPSDADCRTALLEECGTAGDTPPADGR